jgi:polysaccharide biosynthesis transport protein
VKMIPQDQPSEITMVEPLRIPKAEIQMTPAPVSLYASPMEVGGAGLGDLLSILKRQRWKLLAFVLAAVGLAVLVQLTVPKTYEASALVKVDRHRSLITGGEDGQGSPQTDDMDQVVTTEIELAGSDPVLRPIAERYNLLALEKQTSGMNADEKNRLRLAPIELKKLKISRPPNTYLIRISYRAHDPKLASDVANAIAQSLVVHSNDTAGFSMEQSDRTITAALTSLRQKMEAANNNLANYEKQLGIINPEQRATLLNSRLQQLNTELTAVQADRANRASTLETLHMSTTLATAQALDALRTIPDSALSDAVARLNAARQQFALVKSFYGETHPEYAKAKQQVQELGEQVNELVANANDRALAAYKQATTRESRLKQLVTSAKSEVDGVEAKSQQYDQLKSEADNERKLYEELTTKSLLAGINNDFASANLHVVAPARPPEEQIWPKLSVDLSIALVLSSLLGVLGAVLAHAFDTKFTDPEEAARKLQIDVLAMVPKTKRLPVLSVSASSISETKLTAGASHSLAQYMEAMFGLRTFLSSSMSKEHIRTIAVTSALHGEGKSTTTAQLGQALAQIGKKVLIIDADMRRPTMHKILGVRQTPGLSDILNGDIIGSDPIAVVQSPNLFLLPAGPASRRAADLVSLGLSTVLANLPREFEVVLIDCPPVHGAAEAQEIASLSDGVLMLTNANTTSGRVVSAALAALMRSRSNVLGLIMNQVRAGSSTYGYAYGYYPHCGESTNGKRA